jgi:hypothetical protein
VPAWPRRLDDERGEALHPPVDSDVVELDAAFSQELYDVAALRNYVGGPMCANSLDNHAVA